MWGVTIWMWKSEQLMGVGSTTTYMDPVDRTKSSS